MANTNQPWYRRAYRWGQTNLTELDPIRYDGEWWREYWRRTRIHGIIVNAGGIVHYYPSRYLEVHRALYLGDRDLFGEITKTAHDDGLVVLARMDSNRIHERFYMEHPEWVAMDAQGNPYRAGNLYVTCINSPYYRKFLPGILRETAERYQPEGFTDNSYSGLDRNNICCCRWCKESFYQATGLDLPEAVDWDDTAYRKWIEWGYAQRMEVWDLNNRTTQEAGGKDCLWLGMVSGDMISTSVRLRDYRAICKRAEIIMLDYQARRDTSGFQSNGEAGKLLHAMLGWEKLIPESTAMYQNGRPTFRVAAKSEPEARMWAIEGFAGNIQPWWHHIGAYHEDRRQYRTAVSLFHWHEQNDQYLIDRQPVATVGVVWSQQNVDFYGRNDAQARVGHSWQGMNNALIRNRIPYLPVHIDDIDQDADAFSVLILPNLGAMSDFQAESIRRFVEKGGSLVATGESSLYDEWGDQRADFALADLFGANSRKAHHGSFTAERVSWDDWRHHTYLRLLPELRAHVDGPQVGDEPPVTGGRHEALKGFEEADIIPFGGRIEVVEADESSQVLSTLVPHFPIYPPETAWMRTPYSTIPALILNQPGGSGRVAYVPADIDRCYGRDNMPDHGRLLSNLVRWAADGNLPLKVEGRGFVDCHLYRQKHRLILHLVNLTNAETWRATMHELIPIGPVQVSVRLPEDVKGGAAELRVSAKGVKPTVDNGWITFEVPSILDHEMVVIS